MVKEGSPAVQEFGVIDVTAGTGLAPSTSADFFLQTLKEKTEFFTSCHPNAGLPNQFGQYDETPEMMAEQIKEFLDLKLVNIIGGCCGTSPKHIEAISNLVKKYNKEKCLH